MTVVLLIGLGILAVIQTYFARFWKKAYECELRLHCATTVRHEQTMLNVADEAAKHKLILMENGKTVEARTAEEWPEEIDG